MQSTSKCQWVLALCSSLRTHTGQRIIVAIFMLIYHLCYSSNERCEACESNTLGGHTKLCLPVGQTLELCSQRPQFLDFSQASLKKVQKDEAEG